VAAGSGLRPMSAAAASASACSSAALLTGTRTPQHGP
jgi:hypothetical protein